MFGGEKAGVGERAELGREQARQVGENVQNAVNNGEQAVDLENLGATSDIFQDGPNENTSLAVKDAAVDTVMEMFAGDRKLQKEIQEKWGKMRSSQQRMQDWDNYIGAALEAKKNEIGSMMSDEEREAEKRLAEKREAKKRLFSPEQRAEKEKTVGEKLRGSKGFLKATRRLVQGLAIGLGAVMFLSSCGVAGRGGEPKAEDGEPEGMETESDDYVEIGATDDEGDLEEMSEEETEMPVINVEQEMSELSEDEARSLDELLALSKDLDFSEITPEELEMVGNDEKLLAEFESSEASRVLENGLQLNYENGYYSSEKTAGRNSFGPSLESTYEDSEALADGLMAAYFSQPQELAAGVAGFDSVLRAAGVDEETIAIENILERSQAIYQQMLNSEDGGALQSRLRGAFKLALLSDKTSYNFYVENGIEDTFYLRPVDSSTTESPETNLELRLEQGRKRNGAKQVQIVLDLGDHQETMDYNLKCTQANVNERGVPRQPVVSVPQVQEQRESEGGPEGQPDGEPDGEPDGKPDGQPEEEPEGEPDGEPDGEPEGDPEGDPDDDPGGEPEGEGIKPKNPEGQKKVVNEGGQTNPVGQTPNVSTLEGQGIQTPSNVGEAGSIPQGEITGNLTGTYDKTNEPVLDADNKQDSEEGQVGDTGLSEEQQEQAEAEQEKANLEEKLNNMTNSEFADFMNSFLNELAGGGNGGDGASGSVSGGDAAGSESGNSGGSN